MPRQMLAAPDDLRDYREFRAASHEGRRLASAQRYLARHPEGAWAAEVRASFEAEEQDWFERAKSSRSHALEYVVDLPDGPHADAARALLVYFDEQQEDMDTLILLAEARRTAATLDFQTERRKHVSEVILAALAALLDPALWGTRLNAPPAALERALHDDVPPTWPKAARATHEAELFFVLPTPRDSEERVVDVSLQVVLDKGRVVKGLLQGEDLFVHLGEAILVRKLDPGTPADRQTAAATVTDLLSGALEATLPASRCAQPATAGAPLVRKCDGWDVSVRMGAEAGEVDVVDVVGPRRTRK